jgi:dTMP kinase
MIIALEGIDGAGKSTAALDLSAQLTKRGIDNVLISSTSFASGETEREKRDDQDPDDESLRELWELRDELAESFGPRSLCLSNAWEFAFRWEGLAIPSLEARKVIIADRYIDTALVREVLRGIDEAYVRSVYAFAPPPDIVLYIDIDPEVAYRRKTSARLPIGFFESGKDVIRGARSTRMSFVAFQTKCRERYREILARANVVEIDGSRKPAEVHASVVEIVLQRIGKSAKAAPVSLKRGSGLGHS